MKGKLRKGFVIAFVLASCGYILATGIYELTNRSDLYTIKADVCVELAEVEHVINGLIPMGKDHYYIVVNSESGDACIVKGTKRWYGRSFDQTGNALTPDGVTITALAKDIRNYEIERELIARTSQIEGIHFIVGPDHSLEPAYKWNAICKLALIAVTVLLAYYVKKCMGNPENVSDLDRKITLVISLVFVVLLLKVCRVII